MKTKSPLFRSIGALLALLVFVMLPSSTVLANCGQCANVECYYEYAGPTGIQVELECPWPAGVIIFYTINGSTPTHIGSTPGTGTYVYSGPIQIPYHQCINICAIAYKYCYTDSNVTCCNTCNPPQ